MYRLMSALARTMAIIGGIVLCMLVLITTISVTGRSINTIAFMDYVQESLPALSAFLAWFGPVKGDFEMVEAGVAFSIMAFLPWCQLTRGHATVDLFTAMLPEVVNRALSAIWEVLFTAVILIITWRMFIGMQDKIRYGETTFLLQFPVWWGYAACFAAGVVASIVAVYVAWQRLGEMVGRAEVTPLDRSVDH